MRRALTVAGLVAVLALPALANAEGDDLANGPQTAKAKRALSITFTLRTLNGKPHEIRKFRFSGLDAICNGGVAVKVKGRIGSMKIKGNNTFQDGFKKNGKKVRVEGRVRNGGAKVTGKIRASGKYAQQTGCDSGAVRWKAT